MKSKIESLGIYLPENKLSTSDLIKRCKKKLKIDLEKLTGIKERRVAVNEGAIELGIKAAQKALAMSKYEAKDLGLIIFCSISRVYNEKDVYLFEPSLSTLIQKEIGAENAFSFDIENACGGMFTAIQVMDSYIKSGTVKCGLIISGEYITYIADNATKEIKFNLDPQLASLTVGDSGAAIIMDESHGEHGFHLLDFQTGSKYSNLSIGRPSKKGSGAVMVTNPVKLHRVAIKNTIKFSKDALDSVGWNFDEIDIIIPHQTSKRAIEKGKKKISEFIKSDLKVEVFENVEKYGNTSSTSHFLALHEAILNGSVDDDNKVLFMIQFSGLTIGNAIYTMDDLPSRYYSQFAEKKEVRYA